jgi:hypothetical protein
MRDLQVSRAAEVLPCMGSTARKLPFLCECGDVGCEKCVRLTAAEYRELPAEPPGLALAPGHELERSAADGDGADDR